MDESETAQRDKLSTLGEMAAVLAHEIKNPMNSIIINIEVLKSTVAEMAKTQPQKINDKAERYLRVIETEIRRLEKVISGFLDLAAPHQPTKVHFSLNDLVTSLVDLIRLELRQKGVRIQMNLNEELPKFTGSADQIKQAILNLLLNAIQASESEGGKIAVDTGFDDKTIFIQISDSGEGIDEEIITRIFSPYFTTKKKGSGLGLAIVRRIAREHGGYVDVKSTKGQGSEFRIVFPRNDDGRLLK